jgi:hypothetical protein
MPSSGSGAGDRRGAGGLVAFEKWNRRLHFYLGLFFLFFLWLFSLTGLLLNHGQWQLATAANQRRESRTERTLAPPTGTSDLARARDVMRQLGLVGEVDLPAMPQAARHLEFNVSRPTDASQVKVDLTSGRASVQHFDNGGWAVFRILHTFSGSRFNQPGSSRDWLLTSVWVVAMDALAAGLVIIVLGSYYMWFRFKRKRLRLGVLVLLAGYICCALFFRFMWL